MKQRENKIGKLGEKELSKWATQMGICSNKYKSNGTKSRKQPHLHQGEGPLGPHFR